MCLLRMPAKQGSIRATQGGISYMICGESLMLNLPVALRAKSCFPVLILLVFSLSSAVTGHAQTATTSVRGTVTDPSGALISGVAVTITESSIGFTQTHQTNEKGE